MHESINPGTHHPAIEPAVDSCYFSNQASVGPVSKGYETGIIAAYYIIEQKILHTAAGGNRTPTGLSIESNNEIAVRPLDLIKREVRSVKHHVTCKRFRSSRTLSKQSTTMKSSIWRFTVQRTSCWTHSILGQKPRDRSLDARTSSR